MWVWVWQYCNIPCAPFSPARYVGIDHEDEGDGDGDGDGGDGEGDGDGEATKSETVWR